MHIPRAKKLSEYRCECQRVFEKAQSLNAHFRHCLVHRNGKPIIDSLIGSRGWNRGLKTDPEVAAKISRALRGRPGTKHTPESIDKIRLARMRNSSSNNWKGLWKEYYPEMCVRLYLETKNIPFEQEAKFGMFRSDFYFKEFNLTLEVDGSQHWTDQKVIDRDRRKESFLLDEFGVRTIRIRAIDFVKLRKDDQIAFLDTHLLARMEE